MANIRAKTATELKGDLPKWIKYQICPHCDHVYYARKTPFGAAGCGCVHDPANGPQPGDSVVLVGEGDSYYELYKGHRGVVEGSPEWADGKVHLCLSAYVPFRAVGISISGGPFACVDPSVLRYVGDKPVSFWKWGKSGPMAHKGEYYTLTLPVWELEVAAIRLYS